MTRINTLTLSHFRGATQQLELSFPKDKRVVLIFGENGTGKTTIVDAIDFICNQQLGSIAHKGSGQHKYLTAIGTPAKQMQVQLETDSASWTARLKGSRIEVESDSGAELETTHILRRANVQRFIEAKPAEKFNEIRHLLDTSTIEQAEKSLNDAIRQTQQEIKAAESARQEALTTLGSQAAEGVEDPVQWARWFLAQSSPDSGDVHAADNQSLKDLLALQQLIRSGRETADRLVEAQGLLQKSEARIAELPGLNVHQTLGVVDILSRTAALLEKQYEDETCPVCEQPVVPNELKDRVATRLAELKDYQEADIERKTLVNRIAALERDQSRRSAEVRARLPMLAEAPDSTVPADTELPGWSELLERVEARIRDAEKAREDQWSQHGRVASIRALLDSIERTEASKEALTARLGKLQQMATIAREERHAFLQQVLDDVRDECNRLYQQIHPSEGLAFSSIYLDPKQRASLQQTAEFAGEASIPAQAYYSEGHLDTLGFCFWLAYVKQQANRKSTVIVIDDVFSSIDSDHMSRVIELILEESKHFAQIILTTHNRTFHEKMQGTRGANNRHHEIVLDSFWKVESGSKAYAQPVSRSELEQAIQEEPFRRQLAASAAGVALERLFEELVVAFGISMKRNSHNKWTLDAYLSAMSKPHKEFKVQRGDSDEVLTITEPFSQLTSNINVRNKVGGHWDDVGQTYSDREVMAFAKAAWRIVDTLTCPHCGQVPTRVDGASRKCRCKGEEKTRLQPAWLK